jgi:hypothetical protein
MFRSHERSDSASMRMLPVGMTNGMIFSNWHPPEKQVTAVYPWRELLKHFCAEP